MGKISINNLLVLTTAWVQGLGTAVVAAGPELAAPESGLVASYDFTQAPDDDKTVANQVSDSDFGAAEVHKASPDLWNGIGLELTGGHKESGPWKELPEERLKEAGADTHQTESKPQAGISADLHFSFNHAS